MFVRRKISKNLLQNFSIFLDRIVDCFANCKKDWTKNNSQKISIE